MSDASELVSMVLETFKEGPSRVLLILIKLIHYRNSTTPTAIGASFHILDPV